MCLTPSPSLLSFNFLAPIFYTTPTVFLFLCLALSGFHAGSGICKTRGQVFELVKIRSTRLNLNESLAIKRGGLPTLVCAPFCLDLPLSFSLLGWSLLISYSPSLCPYFLHFTMPYLLRQV